MAIKGQDNVSLSGLAEPCEVQPNHVRLTNYIQSESCPHETCLILVALADQMSVLTLTS